MNKKTKIDPLDRFIIPREGVVIKQPKPKE